MRVLSNLRFLLVLISTLLVPVVCLAKQPHSWCNTGKPLIQNDPDSDADTKSIVNHICNDSANCCSDSGRWDMTCVQKAANYAHALSIANDYCGHYDWMQGPITKTNGDGSITNYKQYYPRDFNLVALSGKVMSIMDVEGPIAAKGDVYLSYFHLNNGKREELALLSAGYVSVSNGTINGTVQYGSSGYADALVTYPYSTRPTAATSPSLINFDALTTSMISLSQRFRDHYDHNGTVGSAYGTLTFTGTDQELNVFNITTSDLTNITTYAFNVPLGSAAIITVTGNNPNPIFKNAGFQWASGAAKILWNFPDATALTLNGVGFPGSILAPKAAANMQNGALRGTVVVASASPARIELYSGPFRLACNGGLCLDPTWSCSGDTVMADDGTAAALESEAGFLQIDGGTYQAEGYSRISPMHRVWYSFHPAQFGRKNKPLAVLFNGGPGTGTTPMLFAFNTGPTTVDPQRTSRIVTNPNSWTSFANLLYIDAPATGFSYPLKDEDGNMPDIGNDMNRDASNFLRVIVRFLARHPSLQQNRVILVGESYGGTRASLMLDQLFNYASLNADHSSDGGYGDTQLYKELTTNYFNTALRKSAPTVADIAAKFSHQVLIEPSLLGDEQQQQFYTITIPRDPPQYPIYTVNSQFPMDTCKQQFDTDPKPCWVAVGRNDVQGIPGRQPTCDPYNCNMAYQWSEGSPTSQATLAATRLTQLATLSTALNVNAKTIAWMNDQTRLDRAYGRASTTSNLVETVTPIDLASTSNFGPLNNDDNYLVLVNHTVSEPYGSCGSQTCTPPTANRWNTSGVGVTTGKAFANNVRNGVKTFITVAQYDAVIWSPSIPLAINGRSPVVADYAPTEANVCSSNNNGLRPGVMSLMYDSYPNGHVENITMPTAYSAGHTIPMRAPAELLADVSTWYSHN
jgi:choice-of-anchor A domain-containing protein